MTLVEPTLPAPMPPSTIDFAAVFAAQAEQAAREAQLRPANKDRLFDALTAAGISHVTVTFDGEGDSGQIERIDIGAREGTTPPPLDRIEVACTTWENPKIERQTQTVEEAVETLVYDLLRQTHCGWEINDGAYGEFAFDVAERTIKLDYNERYTSSEHYSHEF